MGARWDPEPDFRTTTARTRRRLQAHRVGTIIGWTIVAAVTGCALAIIVAATVHAIGAIS